MDYNKAIKISDKIYWVGMHLKNNPFQCHPYFIENGNESILIDPGSMIEFKAVVKKIKEITDLKNIKYIILHHQDPDLAASIPEIEKIIDRNDLQIVTHSRMTVLIKHYLVTSDYYEIDKNDLKLTTKSGLTLEFLTTPYCHSPGAFVTYEPKAKVLFSSDIFGGIEESWELFAKDNYFEQAKAFHSAYMPSKDIFNYALRKIEKLDINLIAPQHGSIIERRYVYNLIRDMKNLECGLYIDQKYNEELNDIILKLATKEKELEEYQDHLEEKIKEKTFSLQIANETLQNEQKKLKKFNLYLSELNSVDVGFLADRAIKQIIDIADAQVGVFYIYEKGNLKTLSKYSVDKKLFDSDFFNVSPGGIVQKSLEKEEWIYINGLDEEIAPVIDLGFYQSKLRHIKAIPLVFQDKKIGVVLLGSISSAMLGGKYLKGYINTLVQSLHNAISYIETQKQSIQLKQVNMELEESNRLKSEFLANMSHELRTPLNSIIGFSNILQKNKKKNLEQKQLEQLEKINRNGIHLLELINNILDLSKIESGKMELELREVDIVDTVYSTLELLMPQAANSAKKLLFRNSLGKTSLLYKTDEHKLKQVIINLVGNALKFIEQGHGEVNVELSEEDGILKIAVKDNGIGIEKDKFNNIFEAFRQNDGSTTRKFGGTGLGLTISKNILELLGGCIDLESEVGAGSTFTVCLPITNNKIQDTKNDIFKSNFKQKVLMTEPIDSVLIIDDSKDSRELLTEYLSEENYTIYTASNGEDGIKIAKRVKPSLITLDIMMPQLDGWEVLKRLKMSTETEDIPVILISNAANESKGRVLGAIETLSKPLSRDELKNVINKHFINSKCQKVLIVDDEKDTRDLIREHIGDDVIHIEDARDGKEALAVINNGFVPDLIYLDLMMPNFSGFEFLELARTKQILKETHIVIVTAKDLTKEDIEILQRNDVSIIKKGDNIEAIVKEFAQGKQ